MCIIIITPRLDSLGVYIIDNTSLDKKVDQSTLVSQSGINLLSTDYGGIISVTYRNNIGVISARDYQVTFTNLEMTLTTLSIPNNKSIITSDQVRSVWTDNDRHTGPVLIETDKTLRIYYLKSGIVLSQINFNLVFIIG